MKNIKISLAGLLFIATAVPVFAQSTMETCLDDMRYMRTAIAMSNYTKEERDGLMKKQYVGLRHCRLGDYEDAGAVIKTLKGSLHPWS